MRLIIHAGLHKTATTSFQRLCFNNVSILAKGGLLYPNLDNKINHNKIAIWVQSNYKKRLYDFLQVNFQLALQNGLHSVLISAEDLENVLIDILDAKEFNIMAQEIGFDNIDWIFIRRSSFDYLQSIYAELSKHNLCLNFVDLANVILKNGFFTASGLNYHWKFVFDIKKFFPLLSKKIEGNSFSHLLSFSDFVSGFPGKSLLSLYVEENLVKSIEQINKKTIKVNQRISAEEVELRYLFNFLNIRYTSENVQKYQRRFNDLILSRLNYIEHNTSIIKNEFSMKYF